MTAQSLRHNVLHCFNPVASSLALASVFSAPTSAAPNARTWYPDDVIMAKGRAPKAYRPNRSRQGRSHALTTSPLQSEQAARLSLQKFKLRSRPRRLSTDKELDSCCMYDGAGWLAHAHAHGPWAQQLAAPYLRLSACSAKELRTLMALPDTPPADRAAQVQSAAVAAIRWACPMLLDSATKCKGR